MTWQLNVEPDIEFTHLRAQCIYVSLIGLWMQWLERVTCS